MSLQPGLGDYLDRPVGSVRKFLQTVGAFLKGDPRLLTRNSPFLTPPVYFVTCVALAVAFLKSAWPDDPVKTFESPSYMRPLQLFLDFVPLPLFAMALAYLALISAPMFLAALALRYDVRLSRVIAAVVYAFATFVLLMSVLLFGRIVSYDFFVGDQLDNIRAVIGVWFWFGLACLAYMAFPASKLLGIAHGMSGYRFATGSFLVAVLPFMLIEQLTEPTSGWRRISNMTDLPIQLFQIPSTSMAPALPIHTELIVNRLLPVSQLRPGDIVTFYVPNQGLTTFIERIVGRGGDKIQLVGGALHINGKPVRRDPTDDWVGDGGFGDGVRPIKRWKETLPNGASYFTLDLMDDGPFDDTPLYTVPPDHFFVLGDNRDNVVDSRTMDRIGFVPARNIVGKAYFVLYPRERGHLYKPQ